MSRNIWFTSDWHLGHNNIIKLCSRPFKTVEEMDETIIANFASILKDGDVVYILGDLFWNNPQEYVDRIKAPLLGMSLNIYCLIGNHDYPKFGPAFMRQLDNSVSFKEPRAYLELNLMFRNNFIVPPPQIILCHYPLEDWNGRYKGSIHLHGHTHGQLQINRANEIVKRGNREGLYTSLHPDDVQIPNRFDVSVECTDYKPIHIDEILAKAVKIN